ncbi:GntR family transcriptional regulator [Paraburkholderia sp. JPY419]|uniref:GntR family transcriptional regulator n=1 Tax=Paraburkholderia sp. JPY419 TaxID=667660 RepID=UPI003D190412
MIKIQPSQSLHESVREELRRRIAAGAYSLGLPIPSTVMLSEEFGVSSITVKRALRDLQAAGELTAVPGKGTYVKRQQRLLRQLDVMQPSLQDTSIQAVSVTREKISDPTMNTLAPPDHVMLCIRKTIWTDDAPFMYDITYLSPEIDNEIVEEFGARFVVDVLKTHSIDIQKTHIVIDAAPAAGAVEGIFDVPNGYPMLRRLYRMETSDPGITVYGVVQAPFDRLACTVDFP